MKSIIYTLTVAILMTMALVSPVQAFSSDSVNETSLMIWDSTEMGTVHPFQEVRFYADYTNSTSNSPITGSCKVRHTNTGEWSDWFVMTLNSTDNKYQVPIEFAYSGWSTFEVECDSDDFDKLTLMDAFKVTEVPDRECKAGIRDFTVTDDNFSPGLKPLFRCIRSDLL